MIDSDAQHIADKSNSTSQIKLLEYIFPFIDLDISLDCIME